MRVTQVPSVSLSLSLSLHGTSSLLSDTRIFQNAIDEPKFGAAAAPLVDIGKAKLTDQPEVWTLEEVHAR